MTDQSTQTKPEPTCPLCGEKTARVAWNGETVHLNTWRMNCEK